MRFVVFFKQSLITLVIAAVVLAASGCSGSGGSSAGRAVTAATATKNLKAEKDKGDNTQLVHAVPIGAMTHAVGYSEKEATTHGAVSDEIHDEIQKPVELSPALAGPLTVPTPVVRDNTILDSSPSLVQKTDLSVADPPASPQDPAVSGAQLKEEDFSSPVTEVLQSDDEVALNQSPNQFKTSADEVSWVKLIEADEISSPEKEHPITDDVSVDTESSESDETQLQGEFGILRFDDEDMVEIDVLDLGLVALPQLAFHMCDGLKDLIDEIPDGYTPAQWRGLEATMLMNINARLKGDAELLDWIPLGVPIERKNQLYNVRIWDEFSRQYFARFLKRMGELEVFDVVETTADLFQLEWIKYKREWRIAQNPHNIVEMNGNTYVVLPIDNILSLIRTVNWCAEKNALEEALADEGRLEFVDYSVPQKVLEMEKKGVINPVPRTKHLVSRFYTFLVNYIERLISRVRALPVADNAVLKESTTAVQKVEVITGISAVSSYTLNNHYLPSRLFRSIMEIWSPNVSGVKSPSLDEILHYANDNERRNLIDQTIPYQDMSYENAIMKAVYLYVVDEVDGTIIANDDEVPETYFNGDLNKVQFIGIMWKLVQVIEESARRIGNQLGRSDDLHPAEMPTVGQFGMENIGIKIAEYVNERPAAN